MPIDQLNLADDVRRIVDAIAKVMAVDDDLEDDDAERMHELLVNCVNAVNVRLRNCDDLLRRGLRQESLQECEQPPNVLELVAMLDMPEWDAWAQYVKQFGLPPQPALLLSVAADLNAAYVQAQSLEGLMRIHRRLNLARSPLSNRLSLLRTIALRDPDNFVWSEDVRSFEAARLREIAVELGRLSGDLRAVTELKREVESPEWLSTPPAALCDRLATDLRRLVVAGARQKLAELSREIDAAYAQFDAAAGWIARQEWERQSEVASLAAGDSLEVEVRPAFAWLDQVREGELRQHAFTAAVAQLEGALDDDRANLAELRRIHSLAIRFDEALPERLERRFHERQRAMELAGRRRMRLIAASAGILAILLAGATYGVIAWQLKGRHADGVYAQLNEKVDGGEYKQARDFYDAAIQSAPYLAADTRFIAIISRLSDLESNDAARRQSLAEHLQSARDLAGKGDWSSIDQANRRLVEAKKLVRSGHEKLDYQQTASEVAAQEGVLQDEVDKVFLRDVDKVVARMNGLNQLSYADVRALRADARAAKERRRVSADAISQSPIDECLRKLEDRNAALQSMRAELEALAEVRESIGSPSFDGDFRVYERLRTPTPTDAEIDEAIEGGKSARTAAAAWNKIANQWNTINFAVDPGASAAKEVMSQVSPGFIDWPSARDVYQRKGFAESVAERNGASGTPIQQQISEKLNYSWFNLLWISLKSAKGESLYITDKPEGSQSSALIVRKSSNSNSAEKEKRLIQVNDVIPTKDGKLFGPSPQKQFRDEVVAWMEKNRNQQFEGRMAYLLWKLQQQPAMDPILRCYLLQQFYDIAAPGSTILQEELKQFRAAINTDIDLGEKNWMDFDDEEVQDLRINIQSQLDRIPSSVGPKAAWPRITARLQEALAAPKLPLLLWVGVMAPDEKGQLKAELNPNISRGPSGALVVLNLEKPEVTAPVEIGRLNAGQCELDGAAATTSEGQLAFVVLAPDG